MIKRKLGDRDPARPAAQQELIAAIVDLEISVDFERVVAEAPHLGERAIEIGRRELALWAEVTALDASARTSRRSGDVPGRVHQILEWAVHHDDDRLASRCHALLAMISITAGHLGPGAEHAITAVTLLDGSEHPRFRAKLLTRQAVGLFVAGILHEGLEVSREAANLADELADHELLAQISANAFEASLDFGSRADADRWLRQLQEALSAAPHLGLHFSDVRARGHLAAGRPDEALVVLSAIDAALVDALPDELKAAIDLLTAQAHRRIGNMADAHAALDRVQHLIDTGDLREIAVAALEERALLAAAQGDYAGAYEYHRHFHAAAAQQWLDVRRSQVEYLFAAHRVVEAFEQAEQAVERAEQAEATILVDPLTGAYNRRWMQEVLPQILESWNRDDGSSPAIAILDIDHFKRVNDTYGHVVGDRVLTAVSACLQKCSLIQSVARIGGEEFLLLAHPATSAGEVAAAVLDAVRALEWASPHGPVRVTASLGFATHRPGTTVEGLLTEADQNLYRAKRDGRNTARTSDTIT